MRIAVVQINCTVGDIDGNAEKILNAVRKAEQAGAELIITPELALSGYPPGDWLLHEAFCQSCDTALRELIQAIDTTTTVIIGHPSFEEGKLHNTASVIRSGRIIHAYHKQTLNSSPFFNESCYFDRGSESCIFELAGIRFGINICADFWSGQWSHISHSSLDILLVLSASAYHVNKQLHRHQTTRRFIAQTGIPVIHINLVGGQDELVFDGASFAMNRQGELTHQFDTCSESIELIEIQNKQPIAGKVAASQSLVANIYQVLCLGVRDYVRKNNFPGVLLGLSGGVDSALTLAIAVDALGADHVRTVMMPSRYTADMSLEDAQEMATLLGIQHHECNIQPLFEHYLTTIGTDFHIPFDSTDASTMPENLQARIRGTLLMALSNHSGSIVLTTGNKSEIAVGYCTLYGDMAGGFAVLKDVSKTMVYQLCAYRNQISQVIPERIIQRPPSAELRPNQTDQDSLPPYDTLDAIIEAYVEKNCSPAEIIAMGHSRSDVTRIIRLIHANEYKRRQSPPGIRITLHDFGTAWHYPVTSGYKAGQ